ncbi:DUF4124 domain-containing protein [Pseudomonas chengduensis]|nr:DUF4124 domain-containing protein [Pseudomonas chengduensis]MDH1865746.1 DUF4124 domain-containing protein [Pseudomonas chengduensis]
MFKLLVCLLALCPGLALAQVYKCVGSDGRITFAQVPCPDGDGSATAHHVAPANSIQAVVVPTERESGTARPVDVNSQTIGLVEGSEYQKKIQFQVKSLMAKAAKPGEQDAKAYETAANLLRFAPLNRDGLIAAQDAVSAADRGKAHEASQAARRVAMMTPEGRQYLDELDSQRKSRRREGSGHPVLDQHTGKNYTPVAGGVVDPASGKFYPKTGGGYVDPETARLIPAP